MNIEINLKITDLDNDFITCNLVEKTNKNYKKHKRSKGKFALNQKRQFLDEYKNNGIDYVMNKYNIPSKNACYTKVNYFKSVLGEDK